MSYQLEGKCEMKKILVAAVFSMVLCMIMAVPAWAAGDTSNDSAADVYAARDATGAVIASSDADLATQAALSGGWQMNKKTGTYVTKAQKKLFTKATSGLVGVSYTPVFVMSQQVVAGMNYAYFCKAVMSDAKATASWKVVIVNKPLSGKPSVLGINNFNFKKIKTVANVSNESMDGAWRNITKNYTSKVLPKAARKAFSKATKAYVGVDLTSLVLLSSQVVAGTNYRYLCSGVVPGTTETNYYAVDVYKNLSGKAEVTSCELVDIEHYLDTSN